MNRHAIKSCEATSEDGRRFTIVAYRDVLDTKGHGIEFGKLLTLETSAGQVVNYVEKGVYDVMGGAEGTLRVTSTDPAAP
jgi:hypothetical protein